MVKENYEKRIHDLNAKVCNKAFFSEVMFYRSQCVQTYLLLTRLLFNGMDVTASY